MGPNGRIYKLHMDEREEEEEEEEEENLDLFGGNHQIPFGAAKHKQSGLNKSSHDIQPGRAFNHNGEHVLNKEVPRQEIFGSGEYSLASSSKVRSEEKKVNVASSPLGKPAFQKTKKSVRENIMKKKSQAFAQVIVEDASDDEQDDYLSVWRNRLPSEGQWMEPVEGYDNFF